MKYQIVKSRNFNDSCTRLIERKTKEALGEDMKINIEFLDKISRDRSGKLRIFVSQIKTGAKN